MHILIVKFGALGDVVRTSYFAQSLRDKYGVGLRLSWLTSAASSPLIRHNPYISDVWTSIYMALPHTFDLVYSLDDEAVIVDQVEEINYSRIEGAIRDPLTHHITYTEKMSEWFDMGILSKYGKVKADQLKVSNLKTHAQIFSEIFECSYPTPQLWIKSGLSQKLSIKKFFKKIGINAYAGDRWRSKELLSSELVRLIELIIDNEEVFKPQDRLVLLGANKDRLRNLKISQQIGDERIVVPNTDADILEFAAVIKELDLLITSDSLAMHLAISQKVPVISFFSPTSAAEIDLYDRGEKIISLSKDYCSYSKDCDNSTITAERLMEALRTIKGSI